MTRPGASSTNDPTHDLGAIEHVELEEELRGALSRDDLCLHYQPIVGFHGSVVVGFEALLRWQHPRLGLLAPDRILPIAQAAGLMPRLSSWVLAEACRAAARWAAEARHEPPPSIAVNVSAGELDDRFVASVDRSLADAGLAPELLTIDVHEQGATVAGTRAVGVLRQLADRGVRCSIDDFGAGASTLEDLDGLPVHAVKIDGSLVIRLGAGRDDGSYVRSIVHRAHDMRLTVTAEGIETPRQLSEVRSLGCDDGQGFYFARPQPGEVVSALVHHPFRWRERHPAA